MRQTCRKIPEMSFVLGLCLTYGFLANLPTAVSIECYACVDYPGSPTPCGDDATVLSCPSDVDSCVTMVMGFDYSGYNLTTITKNCSAVQYGGCNESYICNSVNISVVSSGGILTECSVNCCQSDLCNGPAGPGPEPTDGPVGPEPPAPGPDTQSRLQSYIETMNALLDQMESIVENELGGNENRRELKARVRRSLTDAKPALNNEGEKLEAFVDHSKNNAAVAMKKLQAKQDRRKRRAEMKLPRQKRNAKRNQVLNEAIKTIQETFSRLSVKNH